MSEDSQWRVPETEAESVDVEVVRDSLTTERNAPVQAAVWYDVFDMAAALISHLRQFAPLVMVLRSGGKSLHAWWACAGVDEAKVMDFFRYAVSLGADPATWTRSQFVRIPQGWRADKQARQQVLCFDPSKLPVGGVA